MRSENKNFDHQGRKGYKGWVGFALNVMAVKVYQQLRFFTTSSTLIFIAEFAGSHESSSVSSGVPHSSSHTYYMQIQNNVLVYSPGHDYHAIDIAMFDGTSSRHAIITLNETPDAWR